MVNEDLSAQEARRRLYDVMREDHPFERKAETALDLGVRYLGADNGHIARTDTATDHWEAVVSTDPDDGPFPTGLELDLETTYCRRTLDADGSIALHDAPDQGWADDPAFEAHELRCYHGTTLEPNGEQYGTVCFVAADGRAEQFGDDETMFAELVAVLLERELERDRTEAELTRRANLINVLNRVLRHNLRNDMCVIRGSLQAVIDGLDDDTHARAALEKVDDLIQLSQKARRLELDVGQDRDRRTTDVGATVERVATRVAGEYPAASITVERPETVTAAVLPSFERAVAEVVENAAKHGGEAPSVRVTVEHAPNAAEVCIVDDGPGLSETEREVLDSGVETPLIHGSGLGLWLTYWIVTSHDGTIETTVTDEGTSMTISVPRSVESSTRGVTELREARDRYQAAFEEAFDAMLIIDDDARILDANPEAATIYGEDRQALLGRSVREFLPASFDFEDAWTAFQNAGAERDTVTVIGSDGEERAVEYSATTDIVPGQHLVVSRDVTDRLERERELAKAETVFERTQDAMLLVDVTEDGEFRIERVNGVYEDLTGRSSADIRGRTPREILGEESGSAIEARFRECVRRRETIEYREEIPVGGEVRFWNTKLSPVVEDGSVVGLVGAMRDVTGQETSDAPGQE